MVGPELSWFSTKVLIQSQVNQDNQFPFGYLLHSLGMPTKISGSQTSGVQSKSLGGRGVEQEWLVPIQSICVRGLRWKRSILHYKQVVKVLLRDHTLRTTTGPRSQRGGVRLPELRHSTVTRKLSSLVLITATINYFYYGKDGTWAGP